MTLRLIGYLREGCRLDADTEALGTKMVPERFEQSVIIERLADLLAPQAADEVIDIVLGLEAHHIIGCKAAHDGLMHG